MRVVSFNVPAWFPAYEEPGGPGLPSRTSREAPERARLTEQESAVFRSLATGASNAELADELRLSVSTVKFHVVNIRAKLGGISRLQTCLLAALAREDVRQEGRQDVRRGGRPVQEAAVSGGGAAAVPR
ncbi:response regulator transcription factor [Streptomyces sp. NPDC051567]|uniref:response regulator transcription factor n=1 Tax=Streptomyces sp. NPDC051567 TaxID=3365660 RepID=UPI0037A779F1